MLKMVTWETQAKWERLNGRGGYWFSLEEKGQRTRDAVSGFASPALEHGSEDQG
jgi:hypothetical protein